MRMERLPLRGSSIRGHLILLIAIVIAASVAAAWYTKRATDSDGRQAAAADVQFAAGMASREVAQYVSLVQMTAQTLAANPKAPSTLVNPAGCTLTFAGPAGKDRSHLDLLRANGTVACSSNPKLKGSRYTAAWARRAVRKPVFVGPVRDPVTGAEVVVSATPLPGGKGFVAAFVDLKSVGQELADLYGGAHHNSILITTGDGSRVVAESVAPDRWIGRPLAGTAFVKDATSTTRPDLGGVRRIFGAASVPGPNWRLYVGESEQAALASGHRLERRLLWIALASLAAIFLVAFLIARRLVQPLRRLSGALRAQSAAPTPSAVPAVAGPRELEELATDVNALIDSVNRELAERRRAEETLAASEHKYRLLFEGHPSPMWVFDTETLRFLAVNEAATTCYGYSREEFLAMTIGDIRPAEDLEELYADIAAGGQVARAWRHLRKDGTLFDVEITATDHEFDGHQARVVLAIDVTDRIEAERALRRSEARYRDLFENATDLIATVDLESRFTAVNDAFVRTLGYSREELLGAPLASIVPQEDHEQLGRARSDKLDLTQAGTVYTHDLIAKDGRRVPVEVASRVIVEDGEAVGIEAICRDLTERKNLEEQLRQAQRLEAIGRLAGGVAHDFNNLLTVIGGYTEALLERGFDDTRDELAQIAAATERATQLTRQLLAFSRRQVLKPTVVDLNRVVEGITPMLARLIGEDVDLVAKLDPDAENVLADPTQLEQVLVNLAVNARDAMPGGGKLTIETSTVYLDADYLSQHSEAMPGRHTLLAVSDTGTGIDAETIEHVFDPFFTTKAPGSGTGLGLSTVYGIVKQSGGNIWLYSEPGHGTVFKVYLPSVVDQEPEQVAASESPSPQGTETILVAEDEGPLRRLVTERLESLGYAVFAPENAEEAVVLAAQQPIDLLLTDVVMPGMSGRELAETICRSQPEARVLFMSGYADEAVVRHGTLNPGATFLEKPFSSAELARRVRETLDQPLDGASHADREHTAA